MEWKETLRGLLSSYFGDQGTAEGIEELLVVTVPHTDYHKRYLAALDEGIAAAERGDADVVRIIQESFAAAVDNPAEARQYLEELRREYLARYEEARAR
jgi:alkanesulfonate monooxygenase SsuD/methylene tetrahydromethanopterin reductase-like flavin-dependent oxidoreductase (luciferase family)